MKEKEPSKPPAGAPPPVKEAPRTNPDLRPLARRHLRFGWWALFVFLTVGLVLEGLHGFKVGWYLDVSSSTRRHMWTLAHAHGTLLGLVNVAFGLTVPLLAEWDARLRRLSSAFLIAAGILLPGGFFLGGLVIHAGDPGLGILLVPAGGLLLMAAAFLTARAARWMR